MNTFRSPIIVMVTVATLMSTAAFAQYPGGSRGGMGRDGTRNDRLIPRDSAQKQDRASPGATTQAQLDSIEDDLKLTDAQRPLWYAYADQVQKLGDTMSRLRFEARTGSAGAQGGTTVEQLDRIADDERRRAAAIDQIAAASRALYATLNSDQKRIADTRFAPPVMELTFGSLSVRGEGTGGAAGGAAGRGRP